MNVDPLRVAEEVAAILETLRIPYILAGSMASTLHGEPRATMDVDFVVHVTPATVRELCQALEGRYYVDREASDRAAQGGGVFNAIHLENFVKVDIHARARTGIHAEEIARGRLERLREDSGQSVRVATAEDTVLQKLRWYQLGEGASDRQWRDVLGILKVVGERIDWDYIEHWSGELDLRALVERAKREAGIET